MNEVGLDVEKSLGWDVVEVEFEGGSGLRGV